MNAKRKLVFFTGATGMMGRAVLKLFLARDEFTLRILVRPSLKNICKMAKYIFNRDLQIVWGDMTRRRVIDKCVAGVDYVLHIGAMVSPKADKKPALTMRTNLGSTLHIIDAIKSQANADDITLVFIGTVAQTGCRMPPIHWGRCGDPIKSAMFDVYGTSKIAAERAVFESGLKRWVSLRQTGMLPYRISASSQPIIFHQNANNVLEWSTAEESAVLMANVCSDNVPESFWRKCYNIGGGEKWRWTYWEFLNKTMEPLGITIDQFFDAQDLALYNFHGQWYTDSDALNDILPYRSLNPDAYIDKLNKRIERLCNFPLIKIFVPSGNALYKKNNRIKKRILGTAWMDKPGNEEWISAFFGSRDKKAKIKSWAEGNAIERPSREQTKLDHGYDELKPAEALNLDDMKQAAKFRGGKCLSDEMKNGDLFTPLTWQCAFGHTFSATPNLILRGGHWCPVCERESWNYAEIAKVNPFFAQVWTPLHGDEDHVCIVKEVNDESVFL